MTARREGWYICTFTCAGKRWSTFVRAWDAEQAAIEFRNALGEAADRGVISVEPARRGETVAAPAADPAEI